MFSTFLATTSLMGAQPRHSWAVLIASLTQPARLHGLFPFVCSSLFASSCTSGLFPLASHFNPSAITDTPVCIHWLHTVAFSYDLPLQGDYVSLESKDHLYFAFYLAGCQKYFVKNNSLFSSLELEIFGPTELLFLSFLLRFNFASGYPHALLGFIRLKSLLPSQGRVDQALTLIPRAISFIFWPEMNLQLTRSVVTVHFFPLWNTLWRIAFHLPLFSLLRILTPLLTPDLDFIKQLKESPSFLSFWTTC